MVRLTDITYSIITIGAH